ncbi:hypothetical protein ASAP_2486 [Asaia bogorensis]|uniref:Uncharacterized protein n=1 Tax=Asaia bogorensis TaxID=91915 RepID=A0A060QL76_9PROT|nr:hypothetical protein ASAP_2486 [Asaia bogorensis]
MISGSYYVAGTICRREAFRAFRVLLPHHQKVPMSHAVV